METMETEVISEKPREVVLSDMREKKIEAVMEKTRNNLETACKSLPRLQEQLEDTMARAALGEDNHTQVARIKRRIADVEQTILHTPLVIKGLKRMK